MFPEIETDRLRLREKKTANAVAFFYHSFKDTTTRYYGPDSYQHIEKW